MVGARPDVNRLLQAMDIFLFPSLWEGLGIAGVEAQAADLPTLCSEGLPKELKVTDRCEFLPVNDLKSWMDRILNLVEQDHFKLRSNRYEDIKKMHYDIDDMAHWLEEFYLSKERKDETRSI